MFRNERFQYVQRIFGVKEAPKTFQCATDVILVQLKWQHALVYLGKIVLLLRFPDQYNAVARQMLALLQNEGVTAWPFTFPRIIWTMSVARLVFLEKFNSSIVCVRILPLSFWACMILRSSWFRLLGIEICIYRFRRGSLTIASRPVCWPFRWHHFFHSQHITGDETLNRRLSLERPYNRALCSAYFRFSRQ